jgi:hypothetical protein
MFLGKTPRPDPRPKVLEWLRFTKTSEWVAHDRFDDIHEAESHPALDFDPVLEIFPKLRFEDRDPLLCHGDYLAWSRPTSCRSAAVV